MQSTLQTPTKYSSPKTTCLNIKSSVCILGPSKVGSLLLGETMKQGVCHTVTLPFTLKKPRLRGLGFKAKEELWKLKHFIMPKYNLQKNILPKKPKSFELL
jgi:hypothetical protein